MGSNGTMSTHQSLGRSSGTGTVESLRANASPNWCLVDAAKAGDRAAVLTALRSGASTTYVDAAMGDFTALHHAAYYGHHEVCATLICDGYSTDINALSSKGSTALQLAAKYGRERAVKTLLSLNADPNIATVDGETPLHAACFSGKEAVVRALLANGANIGAQTKVEGFTPLHIAASRNFNFLCQELLQAGADANKKDLELKIPYDLACCPEVQATLRKSTKVLHKEGDWVH